MKIVGPLMAVIAIAGLGLAACQSISPGGESGAPPAPRVVTSSELREIVMDADGAPSGMNLDGIYTDRNQVLLRPIVSAEGPDAAPYTQQPGFLAGRFTEFSNEEAGVLSWAALFETADDAARALAIYVDEVQSREGHGLGSQTDADLGDEGAFYSDGGDPELNAQVYLWRVGNLVLAAATYGDFDPGELGQLAEGMDNRAR
jgi:hypothetical protein